jgi:hypothetical protein
LTVFLDLCAQELLEVSTYGEIIGGSSGELSQLQLLLQIEDLGL